MLVILYAVATKARFEISSPPSLVLNYFTAVLVLHQLIYKHSIWFNLYH